MSEVSMNRVIFLGILVIDNVGSEELLGFLRGINRELKGFRPTTTAILEVVTVATLNFLGQDVERVRQVFLLQYCRQLLDKSNHSTCSGHLYSGH